MRLVMLALLACSCGQPLDEPALPGETTEEIHAWLTAGEYLAFNAESEVLPGIVQGGRRVFVNEPAARALASHAAPEPGAIAVRELYADDLVTLSGWGFSRRTAAGWQYYETFAPADPGSHSTFGLEASICAGCHAGRMVSDWPLP